MSFSEVLASYEADEIDEVDALELSGCFTLIDLYERAADEVEASPIPEGADGSGPEISSLPNLRVVR